MSRNYNNIGIRFIYIFYIHIDKSYEKDRLIAYNDLVQTGQRCLQYSDQKKKHFLPERISNFRRLRLQCEMKFLFFHNRRQGLQPLTGLQTSFRKMKILNAHSTTII